jgi:hypothetical protein
MELVSEHSLFASGAHSAQPATAGFTHHGEPKAFSGVLLGEYAGPTVVTT